MSITASAVRLGWTVATAETSNAVATAQKNAEASKAHYVTGIDCAYDTDVGPLLVEVYDDTTVIWRTYLRNGEMRKVFAEPIRITAGKLTKATLAAGGAGVKGIAAIDGFTVVLR